MNTKFDFLQQVTEDQITKIDKVKKNGMSILSIHEVLPEVNQQKL